MAKEVITRLIDDITKEPVPEGQGESVQFSINGTTYELDLNDKNAKKFHDTMQFYIDHGTAVEAAPTVPTRVRRASGAATKSTKADKEQLQAMREWLRANGHQVSDRGRIAKNLQDLYNEAHK